MSPVVARVLFTIAIQLLKLLREYYGSLTPEQRAELDAATKECFDNAGNMGPGVNE